MNLRYLGAICRTTTLPNIKEICLVEMIARSAKKVLNKQLSEIMHDVNRESQEQAAGGKLYGYIGK